VILLSSRAAKRRDATAYRPPKAGIIGMARTLALELAPMASRQCRGARSVGATEMFHGGHSSGSEQERDWHGRFRWGGRQARGCCQRGIVLRQPDSSS